MNNFLKVLPIIIGVGFAYPVASYIAHMKFEARLIASSISILGLCYFFNWYNIWLLKRDGKIKSAKDLTPNSFGHLLNVMGAALAGYGFSINNKILILLALAPILYADTLLTRMHGKQGLRFSKEKKTSNSDGYKEDALLKAIEDKKSEDPLIGIKFGSIAIFRRIQDILRGEKGIHCESLLGAIGALGGFSCHAAFRDELIATGKHAENEVFVVVTGKDGRSYYFGDLPNKLLIEENTSIWSLVSGAVQRCGVKELPDIQELVSRVSSSVGGEQFGIPCISKSHMPSALPLVYVNEIWQPLLPIIDKFCSRPLERPLLFGLIAQQAIEMVKETIPPELAAKIIMECAIPMSKIGPDWLGVASNNSSHSAN